ncbi:hypothetical protein F0562_031048 [Nyssa sinensis]|uniref:Uncharacterized protein n=1 Tax=Nyssa sinensis TaxID=561372 RepID=A0A5J5AT69_9ASTE|nr:hypothetical protein F0562_031048 [Nyssa sinensis]
MQNNSFGQDAFSVGSVGGEYDNLVNSLEESSSRINAVGSGDTFGTGIRIRPRQPQNSAQNIATQGTALRRIRLQNKLEVGSVLCSKFEEYSYSEENREAKPVVTEAEKATDKHASATVVAAATIDDRKLAQRQSLKMRSRIRLRVGADKKVPSVLSEAPPALRSISSSVYMVRVVLVVGLLIIFTSLWRSAVNFEVA